MSAVLPLDSAAAPDARAMLFAACGSTRWVDRMLARRPFGSRESLLAAAREEWFALAPANWLEAFSHHPRIGDRAALAARFPETHALSSAEQSGVAGASSDILDALARENDAYLERFGFIFIVCATGKTAEDMLAELRRRLDNELEAEIAVAAAEQAKITALRLSR